MSRAPFDLDHFQYRLIVDAMNEATAGYWRRRARAFAAALPRTGDFLGAATPEQHAERSRLNRARIVACSQRAALCGLTPTEERLALDAIADSHARAAQLLLADADVSDSEMAA